MDEQITPLVFRHLKQWHHIFTANKKSFVASQRKVTQARGEALCLSLNMLVLIFSTECTSFLKCIESRDIKWYHPCHNLYLYITFTFHQVGTGSACKACTACFLFFLFFANQPQWKNNEILTLTLAAHLCSYLWTAQHEDNEHKCWGDFSYLNINSSNEVWNFCVWSIKSLLSLHD